jgi:Double zinc ribbon
MTCPRCHAENRDGLRFCEDCGSQLSLICAQCGGELAPGKRFCGSRGTPAVARADELGMRPLAAHCHLGLGTLYRRLGKREPAQEHLTTAVTMCREMDMGFWLEQAKAEMSVVG